MNENINLIDYADEIKAYLINKHKLIPSEIGAVRININGFIIQRERNSVVGIIKLVFAKKLKKLLKQNDDVSISYCRRSYSHIFPSALSAIQKNPTGNLKKEFNVIDEKPWMAIVVNKESFPITAPIYSIMLEGVTEDGIKFYYGFDNFEINLSRYR